VFAANFIVELDKYDLKPIQDEQGEAKEKNNGISDHKPIVFNIQ
jgi:hypothetical protein